MNSHVIQVVPSCTDKLRDQQQTASCIADEPHDPALVNERSSQAGLDLLTA